MVYAPGLRDPEAIRAVCASVDRPVNVVMGLAGAPLSIAELARAGVRRISTGGSLMRAAMGELRRAADEIMAEGSFTYANRAIPGDEIDALMDGAPGD